MRGGRIGRIAGSQIVPRFDLAPFARAGRRPNTLYEQIQLAADRAQMFSRDRSAIAIVAAANAHAIDPVLIAVMCRTRCGLQYRRDREQEQQWKSAHHVLPQRNQIDEQMPYRRDWGQRTSDIAVALIPPT